MSKSWLFGIATLIVIILVWGSVFIVREPELAARFQLGELVETDYKPGLHWKFPFVQNVIKFERRLRTLDAQPERFITSEKKDVIVDSFVKWRIVNTRSFFTSTGGDARQARTRLSQIMTEGLRSEFAKRTLREVVSGERGEIMDSLTITANEKTDGLGIQVVDVRIKRIDLPDEVSGSVFRRMRAERSRVANELRAQGREAAERIRADADRQAQVIMAEADRDAQRTRGEGDARAAETYAEAYNEHPNFYAFYRSLEAYRNTFGTSGDMLLLDAKSDFFEYFNDSALQGASGPGGEEMTSLPGTMPPSRLPERNSGIGSD